MSILTSSPIPVDRAGVIRPDLIPLAAFLCAEEYDAYARSLILDHAAAGAPLAVLTVPTPDGWVILEPSDLDGASEALARGGPSPAVDIAPDPAPLPEPPSLAEMIAVEARRFRGRRPATPAGQLIADWLDRLAQVVHFTGAETVAAFRDRYETHERDLLASEYDRGFDDGRRDAYCPR